MPGIVRRSGGTPRSRAARDALSALEEAVMAADPRKLVHENLKLEGETLRVRALRFDLSRYRRVLVLGGGKASGKMALELESILGVHITGGVVNVPEYQKLPRPTHVTFNPATHPAPSSKGTLGVKRMLKLVGSSTKDDLVICLFSGGGSALLPLPLPGVTIGDMVQVTDLLLRSGADIHEINAVRKHLSSVTGGRLAEFLSPATVVSLIISDVVGDRIDSVSSGPTAPDPTTFQEAKRILVKRNLWGKVSSRVRGVIADGVERRIKETPKPGSGIFRQVHNIVIGSNRISRLQVRRALEGMGYRTSVMRREVTGEARGVGLELARMVKDRISEKAPWALVGGGETVVTVSGTGKGGRNQELVLSVALGIQGTKNVAVCSMATDGIDGPTDAAGAIADGDTVARGKSRGLRARSYLARNDSYMYFRELGDLLVTGPTGTNVNDIFVAVGRPAG